MLGWSFTSTLAQSHVDSLWGVWTDQTQADSLRFQAIDAMASLLMASNTDSAILISNLMEQEAIKNQQIYWQAEAYGNLALCYDIKSDYPKAIAFHRQALDLFRKIKDQKGEAGTLSNMGKIYFQQGDYDAALEHYHQGAAICAEIGDRSFGMNIQMNIAVIFLNTGDFLAAIENFEEVLFVAQALKQPQTEVIALLNLSLAEKNLGNYPRSLDYLYQAMRLYDRQEGLPARSYALRFLGGILQEMESYEEAEVYFNRGLELAKGLDSKDQIATVLHDLAGLYRKTDRGPKALANYLEAIKYYEEIGNKTSLSITAEQVARYHQENNQLEEAIPFIEQVQQIGEAQGDQQMLAHAAFLQGQNHFLRGQSTQALPPAQRAHRIYTDIQLLEGVQASSELLYQLYKSTGQANRALAMYEQHISARDSIQSEANQKAAIKQQYQYEYEKQKQLDDLENEKRLAVEQEQKQKQQNLSMAIAIGLILTLILAIFIYNRLQVTRQQKAIIEQQKAQVEQSEKYKEQFLANMSHEIRTPMHAISGMVKILQRNQHPSTQDVYLDAMQTSSDNLLIILNDVLDLSKIEAGKLDIQEVPMSVIEVVENVLSILKYKAEDKGLLLQAHIDPQVPTLILGDPARLNQVLTNLLGNAIKFTDRGQVGISLSVLEERIQIAVQDTGIGIPAEKLQSIFRSFEQVKSKERLNAGGTGLGLSISQQLVHLMDGQIWIESQFGEGSTFFLSLPLKQPETDASSTALLTEDRLKETASALRGLRILLAEDNPFNQMIAQDDLSFYIEDIQVDLCENGRVALERYQAGTYDLILMDVQMPELDGFEATRAIRALEQETHSSPIPIIAMTASLLKTEIDQCLEAGMNNYIPKPYKPEELIGVLHAEYQGSGRK